MQDILYQRIASSLEHQISNGTLKTGDKMPSLRTLCQEYGVSMTTAIQAYLELEAKALIVSRPKSGYFVSWRPTRLAVPSVSRPALRHTSASVESLIAKVYHSLGKDDVVNFAVSVPDTDLVPIARLNK